MCGIVGISYGKDGPAAELWTPSEWLQIMLPASVHRGPHAYGWMYLTQEDEIVVVKFQGRADSAKAISRMEVPDDVKWLVGHVRWFTTGSPSNPLNNHPISHGKFVGVHNGVVRNHTEVLKVTGREDDRAEVDSEAIFAAVNKWGHRQGLGRIRADMVAVYANRELPNTLHIARSHGRPLVFAKTDAGSLMFASESGIIDSCGMKGSRYSSLSMQRLVRVKSGRIYERIDLTPYFAEHGNQWQSKKAPALPANASPAVRYYHPDRWRNPLAEAERAEADAQNRRRIREANDKADQEFLEQLRKDREAGKTSAPRAKAKPAKSKGYNRSQSVHFKNGDAVGTKIYYNGILMTHEEYYGEKGSKR